MSQSKLPSNINIIQYTERCIVVQGPNTKQFGDMLWNIGGIFNRHLKCGPGWIFPKREEEKVLQCLFGETKDLTCEISYKPQPSSKCFLFLQVMKGALHLSCSKEEILIILTKCGYKNPEKFFRQISTKNTGNTVPQLLEETEDGWKLIHKCVRTDPNSEETKQTPSELEPEQEEESEPEEEDESEEDDKEIDPDYTETSKPDFREYVSRREFNMTDERIKDLEGQIASVNSYIFNCYKSEVTPHEEELPQEEETPEDEEELPQEEEELPQEEEELPQEEDTRSKRCRGCITM